jgi:hypothetical protein
MRNSDVDFVSENHEELIVGNRLDGQILMGLVSAPFSACLSGPGRGQLSQGFRRQDQAILQLLRNKLTHVCTYNARGGAPKMQ